MPNHGETQANSNDWRAERVQAALDGRNPTVLAELEASFAALTVEVDRLRSAESSSD